MKSLSIKQPWADQIARGLKTIETRTWSTRYRGDLLIHAGKKPYPFMTLKPETKKIGFKTWLEAVHPADRHLNGMYIFGACYFIAELYHIEPMTEAAEAAALCSVYPGAHAWHLRNIRPIPPFYVTGQLGIFEVKY